MEGAHGDFPSMAVQPDSGGEISLSIEETNKLRAALGLKPLKMDSQSSADAERKNAEEQRKQQEQERMAAELRARIAAHKDKRAQDAFFRVKTLGQGDDDEDDMSSWVQRSRQTDASRKAEEARRKAAEEEAKRRKMEEDDEDEDGPYGSKDLAGLKVRHNPDELGEGETMVLTLADRRILDERGGRLIEEEDELENVLKAEDRKRAKARDAAAPKAKPLWEEDGKRRGLLDKYDEGGDEPVLELGAGGAVEAERLRKEEMRRKLAEGGKLLESIGTGEAAPAAAGASDYMTAEEAAARKEKRKREKKSRKIRSTRAGLEDEEDGPGSTARLIEQLEAQAAEAGGSDQAMADAPGARSDLGSRTQRLSAREKAAAAEKEEAAQKRARFEAAVQKGNWASQMLRPQAEEPLPVVGEDDADRELRDSLERARRAAQQKSKQAPLEEIAAAAAKKREEDEAKEKEEAKAGLLVTDTIEFVRNIQVKPEALAAAAPGAASVAAGAASVAAGAASRVPPPPPGGPPGAGDAKDDDDDYMDLDKEEAKPSGRWVSSAAEGEAGSEGGEEEGAGEAKGSGRQYRRREEGGSREGSAEPAEESVVGEKAVGRGLAATLALLKNKGELGGEKHIVWGGRNTDKSKNALQGLDDVYTGGSKEDRIARSIEQALTHKDEFGRIITPKERFRILNYQFHGKMPSKNKQEKRVAKALEEIARRKAATSEVVHEAEKLEAVTAAVAQPYLVLQGKGAQDNLKALAGGGLPPKGGFKKPPPPSVGPQSSKK